MKKLIGIFVLFLTTSAQLFFPLEVGNTWQYEYGHMLSTERDTFSISVIKDTLMPNESLYYELSQPIDKGGLDFRFVRADSNGIYFYDQSSLKDELVYNLFAEIDEPYIIGYYSDYGAAIRVWLTQKDTMMIFGFPSLVYHFELDNLVPFSLNFSHKFGPIFSYTAHHEPYVQSLIGCKIGGVIYGTLVDVKKEEEIPTEFMLYQNYPNPFNPTTTINFTITGVGDENFRPLQTQLIIYDILGREVKTLLNEQLQSGSYEIKFNAEDLPSGIYYYRLTAGEFSDTKKMVLLR